jgi:hypothetical protein
MFTLLLKNKPSFLKAVQKLEADYHIKLSFEDGLYAIMHLPYSNFNKRTCALPKGLD